MQQNDKIENKSSVIKRLRERGEDIRFYSDAVKHDIECVKAAMEYNRNMNQDNKSEWIKAYDYLPEEMKNNPEVVEYFVTLYTAAPKTELSIDEEREWNRHIKMQQNEYICDRVADAMSHEYYLDNIDIWKELSQVSSDFEKTKLLRKIIDNMAEEEYYQFIEKNPSPAREFLNCNLLGDVGIAIRDNYLIAGRRPSIDFSGTQYDLEENEYTRK